MSRVPNLQSNPTGNAWQLTPVPTSGNATPGTDRAVVTSRLATTPTGIQGSVISTTESCDKSFNAVAGCQSAAGDSHELFLRLDAPSFSTNNALDWRHTVTWTAST